MSSTPSALPENLIDIMLRTECLELWNKYFAEIKKKGISNSTKELVAVKLKETQNRDNFSFLFLSFLKVAADFVEPGRYEEFLPFDSLLRKSPISQYLREYKDSTQDPPIELITALSDAIEEIQSKMGVAKQKGLSTLEVARLLQRGTVTVD